MDEHAFKSRTKALALAIIRLVDVLPRNRCADILGRQLLRSGTSVGANYRAACRGQSRRDMMSKLSIVAEEADEMLYWMELLGDSRIVRAEHTEKVRIEATEILAMTVASLKTLKRIKTLNQPPESKSKI